MAGYSGTPLVQKLGIKPDARVHFANAPADFADTLGPLPAGAEQVGGTGKDLDLVVLFVIDRAALRKQFGKLADRLTKAGMLWVGWPKKASGVPTELTENVVRDIGLAAGLVDVKVCAIDETWSGLKFVYRLRDR
ncbi:MAG TPA: hypothetical protein VH120_01875 [Gemmataceae bacterium]|jgi:hypothetical protein|nr:hypothetical protein [Gemmataceae bacterium]